jgi:putative transposase
VLYPQTSFHVPTDVGRKHVTTSMRKMGIEAIYRRANTSRRHPRHAIYPYLLRNLTIDRPNGVWATDESYLPMARGFVYLVPSTANRSPMRF